jgi:hypothetical protein
MFPNVSTNIVISDTKFISSVPKDVRVFEYSRTEETAELFRNLSLPDSFRGGFWYLTLERLFALDFAHQQIQTSPILHVESDMLLFSNFPWEFFENSKKLMWGRVDISEDIPALLFSPNRQLTSTLVKEIKEEILRDPATSDMRMLRAIALRATNGDFEYLPSGIDLEKVSGGFFDVGTLGMWLTGEDPRNNWGKRVYFRDLPHHLFKPQQWSLEIMNNQLLATREGEAWAVFSLHVHSKDLELFGNRSPEVLQRLIRLSRNHAQGNVFVLGAWLEKFVELAKELFSRRALRAVLRKLSRR